MKKEIIVALLLGLVVPTCAKAEYVSTKEFDVFRNNVEYKNKETLNFLNAVDKRNIMNTKNITELQLKKVDKTTYEAGQKKQDDALTAETVARIEGDKRNAQDIGNLNTAVTNVQGDITNEAAQREAGDKQLANGLSTETQQRIDGDNALSLQMNESKQAQAAINTSLATSVSNETTARQEADKELSGRIDTKVDVEEFQAQNDKQAGINQNTASSIKDVNNRADTKVDNAEYQGQKVKQSAIDSAQNKVISTTNQRIDNTNAYVDYTNGRVDNVQYGVSQAHSRIDQTNANVKNLAATTNSNFRALREEVNSNKKRADAGIAGVAAMASIPSLRHYETFNIGAGIGNRGGQQAIAVGLSAALDEHTTVKVSTSYDTKGSFTTGAGVSYGW